MVHRYIENINAVYPNVSLGKYIIMPNHVHIIIAIQPDGTPRAASPTTIPKIINFLKTLTSKQHGCTLWQRSYYDHVVRSETEYREIWEYIDTNPQKWQEDCYYQEYK